MKRVGVLLGAILGAVAASACCILPALLGIASASTLGLGSTLAPYRPYLMALTIVLLALGFYCTYRTAPGEGCRDEECRRESAGPKRFSRALLWVVTVFTVGTMLYPWATAYRADQTLSASSTAPPSARLQTVTFAVGKMSCAECTAEIRKALMKTPGVSEATVDFEDKRATVSFDPSRVSVVKLKAVIAELGFSPTAARATARKQQAMNNIQPLPLRDGTLHAQSAPAGLDDAMEREPELSRRS